VLRESRKSDWERFWKSKASVHDVYSNADRILRNLTLVTDLQGKRILEVGAGTGRDSLSFVKRGAVVFQLDYAESSLSIIRTLAEEEGLPVHAVRGDALDLPFLDSTFDVVFHQGLLEHFREKEAQKLLAENVRVLKRGGLLLIDVPQRYHIYTVLKHVLILVRRWFAGWEREFSIRELEGIINALGLTLIHSYGEWMYPSLVYRIIRAALGKMRIALPLYPELGGVFTRLRRRIRERAWRSEIILHTALSIGVIGRKA
jgi:SAM-dependent methyltransferase